MLGRFSRSRTAPEQLEKQESGSAETVIGATTLAAVNIAAPPDESPLQLATERAWEALPPEIAGVIMPANQSVTQIEEKTYRSGTFRKAAFDRMPGRYGDHDRSLTTVTLDDGAQVLIASSKITSDNPYEVSHAAARGLDLRGDHTLVYYYDGKQTLTEYLADGETNTYVGEFGTPDALLPHLLESLGEQVGSETFRPS